MTLRCDVAAFPDPERRVSIEARNERGMGEVRVVECTELESDNNGQVTNCCNDIARMSPWNTVSFLDLKIPKTNLLAEDTLDQSLDYCRNLLRQRILFFTHKT